MRANASFNDVRKILSDKGLYPSTEPIEVGGKNGVIEDDEKLYWEVEERNLIVDFEKKVISHFENNPTKHFSLFALAPQPLLIKLGTLIPDLYTADVYQKHREPDTWEWQDDSVVIEKFGSTLILMGKDLNLH